MFEAIFSPHSYSFHATALPSFAAAAATLLVGLFVMVREKGSRVSLLFFVYALTASLWLFSFAMAESSPAVPVITWWARTAHIALALLPAALYHFTVVVLQTGRRKRRSVRIMWIIASVFLGTALFTDTLFHGFYWYSWGPFTRYTWTSIPFVVYFFAAMVAILRSYWMEYRTSGPNTTKRARARELLIAFGIGYLGTLDFLPAIGIPYRPTSYLPMLVLLVLVARVIWRYRLVDITPAFAAHQIIDTMNDALLVLDREGIIRLTNRAAAALFGLPEQEMAGRPVSAVIDDPLFSALTDQVDRAGRVSNFELARPGRGGAVFLSFSASLLHDQAGQPAGLVCVARDITDRKRMEEDRLRTQKLESLGVLAGGIAHDFNNLLTGILGNLSLAQEFVTQGDEVDTRLREAEKASLWARDLTQQLLTFSRGGAPVRKTLAIGAVVRDAAELALRGARTRAEFRIPADLWTVDADEGQLRQVVHNIVLNADQAMPGGGVLEVWCANTSAGSCEGPAGGRGDCVRISIRDRGVGIPAEHLEKIFDPYYSTKQKGSGLGLATAYSIIKRHEGFIRAESRPAEGTVFHIYLPASHREPVQEQRLSSECAVGKGRVLVMDDEEILRSVASRMLQHLGYAVVVAKDGREAVRMYEEARETREPFDVVILDLTVPGGMGGADALRRLREIDPQVRAVVSSGYSQDPVMADFETHGFAAVVPKPYRIADLGEAVQKAMQPRSP